MTRNAIQMMERISELIDRVKSARHPDREYMNAINDAISMTINDRIAPIRVARKYSVQSVQRVRDELYTLIPTPATGTPSSDIVPFPADYYAYLLLWQNINSIKQYCRPTNYNTEGALLDNPFLKPSATKPYFNEYSAGLRVLHNSSGTMGTYELWYVKKPDVVSIGEERDKITSGTLTNLATYYVYDQVLLSAPLDSKTIYYPGETIIGNGVVTLTSGTVILSTNVINCNLPGNIHEEIILRAAASISGDSEMWNKKQMLDIDAEKA